MGPCLQHCCLHHHHHQHHSPKAHRPSSVSPHLSPSPYPPLVVRSSSWSADPQSGRLGFVRDSDSAFSGSPKGAARCWVLAGMARYAVTRCAMKPSLNLNAKHDDMNRDQALQNARLTELTAKHARPQTVHRTGWCQHRCGNRQHQYVRCPPMEFHGMKGLVRHSSA